MSSPCLYRRRPHLLPLRRRFERVCEVLHTGMVKERLPYTGVIAEDQFYFNLSTDLDEPPAKLEPLILAVEL